MLSDVKVLDFTQSIAGPEATERLGALGADVIKVEPPSGDAFRGGVKGSTAFGSVNTTKRSIAIDLKTERGTDVAQELAEDVDVIVESFRPGVMADFGLGYESVSEFNNDIIYCSITGFGQEGPYRHRPAYDPILQAMSGIMDSTGYKDRPPVRIGTTPIDYGTGTNAALAILGAIRARDRTGEGEYIDVSLFDTAIRWMSRQIGEYSVTGEEPVRSGAYAQGFAFNGVFHAQDGPFYLAASDDKAYQRLCHLFDRDDLLEDERFQTLEGRWNHRGFLKEVFEEHFREMKRSNLVEYLTENGVPAGPIQRISDVVNEDQHVMERNMLTDSYNLADETEMKIANIPYRFDSWSETYPPEKQPPTLGEDSREVLNELDYSQERIERLITEGIVFE